MSDLYPNHTNRESIDCNVTIVSSEFNSDVVSKLFNTTVERLKEISSLSLSTITVPGASEQYLKKMQLWEKRKTDAIICLGAIIRGDTTHYELISENVFKSISDLNNLGIIPIINGILTTENISQAKDRIKNGIYFADTCLHMIKLNKDLT